MTKGRGPFEVMREKEAMFTYEMMASKFRYDPETGLFYRHIPNKIGWHETGTKSSSGYIRIRVDQVNFPAHRVAYLLMTGEWPPVIMDHINGDKTDNRWINIRPASFRLNNRNASRLFNLNALSPEFGARQSRNPLDLQCTYERGFGSIFPGNEPTVDEKMEHKRMQARALIEASLAGQTTT